ncbi:hypothetical protein M5K25_016035 [Dendrobium thyrsiflorum]|uniref:Uncharacterized protein n=1 Tax=Dendrobium thyrsiflorum TaxID=117978 RepID=A0ABD0UYW0_DENTH
MMHGLILNENMNKHYKLYKDDNDQSQRRGTCPLTDGFAAKWHRRINGYDSEPSEPEEEEIVSFDPSRCANREVDGASCEQRGDRCLGGFAKQREGSWVSVLAVRMDRVPFLGASCE